MSGQEVKALILASGVRIWQVADEIGMQDSNFSRKLRHPFSDEEVEKVKAAIEAVKSKK